VNRCLTCGDGVAVHHLHCARQHSRGDDVADGLRGGRGVVEGSEQRFRRLGAANDAQDDACRDSQSDFGADEDSREIIAGRIDDAVFGAEPGYFTRRENDFATKNVGQGETVLEAVRSASVFGEITAEGADALLRRIGRIEEGVRFDSLRNLGVRDFWFHRDEGVVQVDGKNAVHAGEGNNGAAFLWERTAAEACSGTTGNEGDFVFCADTDCGLDFNGGAGKNHCPR